MRIDENIFKTIKRVENLTLTDYNIIWKDAENVEGFITSEDLYIMVQDLLCEIDNLEEKIEDLENKEEPDNYDAWQDQQLEAGLL